jgi:hypothetical protein
VASADPTNAKNAAVVTGNCDNGQTLTVVVNGNGNFNAVHDANSTSTFVPTMIDLTFTFHLASGGSQTNTQQGTKNGPAHNVINCDIPLQTLFTAPDGSFATIEGSVSGFLTPNQPS